MRTTAARTAGSARTAASGGSMLGKRRSREEEKRRNTKAGEPHKAPRANRTRAGEVLVSSQFQLIK